MAKKNQNKEDSDLNIRKPQVTIPLNQIELDPENPRLGDQLLKGSQYDLISALYSEFDLEEIALSMAENGYFDEEPIIVIPKNLPKKFKSFSSHKDVLELQNELQSSIEDSDLKFIVVEGNRRVSTAKVLTDDELRKRLKIKSQYFPSPKNNAVLTDLQSIPAIVYENRDVISPYLGVRHIIGPAKWDAFPTALYIAKQIDFHRKKGNTINEAIEIIQRKTGDRSDKIKKQFLYYKIFKEAEDGLDIDPRNVKRRFSLLEVAMRSPSIRQYIDAKNYNEVDFKNRVVNPKKYEQFQNVMTWIFGNGKGVEPIITDSRRITADLAKVLSHPEAKRHLERTSNLDDAYELSDGERDMFYKKLTTSKNNLTTALGYAFKYKKDEDAKLVIEEISEIVAQLKKMIKK